MAARARESGLWAWLRDGAPADCVLERIENSVSRGTPDVVGCAPSSLVFWCELKAVARRPSGDVWCELKPEQASFLRRWAVAGCKTFVLVQVGVGHTARRYLIRAADCLELLKPLPEVLLAGLSICRGKNTPKEIITWITKS